MNRYINFLLGSLFFILNVQADVLEIPRNYKQDEHKKFLASKEQCVQDLVKLFDQKTKWQNVLLIASGWRSRAALESKDDYANLFGNLRDCIITSDVFLAGGEYMLEKIDLVLKSADTIFDMDGIYFPGAPVKRYSIREKLEGEEFLLTQLIYFHGDYPVYGYIIPRLFRTPHLKYTWYHTGAQDAIRILELLENVYLEILDESNQEQIVAKIARLHWWFSQSTPYNRGSAAIAEAIAQALLRYKGLNWEKIPYLMIDVVVLCEPCLEEFIRLYPTFYREKREIEC